MELKKLTSTKLISLDLDLKTKDEVIRFLVKKLAEEGKLHSEEEFYKDVIAREKLSPTGLEAGLAVPHGKSRAVKEASFAVAKLKKPIEDWESVDENNKVEFVFLLAIPEEEAGSTHLELLAELAKRISNSEYKERLQNSKSAEELYRNLDDYKQENYKFDVVKPEKSIVAVTACPAGIAHTYMAAEALQKAGRELGIAVYVEKQGANGIEDPHTDEQLRNADAAIFAADVAVKNEERYKHLPIYRTNVTAPLKNAKEVIEKAFELAKDKGKKEYKQEITNRKEDNISLKSEIKNSILTGISHIIPIIVAGGMILAFAVLVAQGFGLQEIYNKENSWLWMFRKLGGNMLGTLMVPVLSAYMAYAIAEKPALGPGFAAGVAANLINGGFLGGMLGGFLAGYIIKYMKKSFPAKGTFAGFISFWVYPVVGSLTVGALMLLVFGKPVAALNQGLLNWLNNLSGSNAILLGAVIGIMVSFDLGGPINKAAYTFCIGAMANGNFVPYAAFASVKMVSAFAVTAATLLFKRYYEEYEREVGKSTWLLGLAGITEGAIPFMIEDPLRVIPSLCIGSAVTGAIVVSSNIGLSVPGAGIFSLFVLQGAPLVKAGIIWFGAALIGAAISTLLLVATRIHKLNKKQQ
ncbi:PTS 2-O-a-mannosyl-D-glycerate transporter subunit IIABC [Fonticella tunisiensis]|uniref:PTS system mannosylglycerate-specific IIA component (Fru family) /PTS system mannosylglycerate-specific IIB component (Fru family) /PTS system mannosylglycerate-specific IIC component (Fru family) n=1 Tax=Fonticella tunisiensis TaxID=1096341 RepID=A0A4R7KUC6_9CLOT|nr:PTS 2-O-a-mannosyl-D-glycerate transporter subunit IIABC [Fonticella tunisiensis]TDT62850.1 PTS system mannosylglycerate-specific IIA component (Fru family) /PTS system mannosylglycerate-specific IIB component (Fru family) /PTS system mannosylglycerate-specific IIC component (Fru family) [Fonticella tunisiensis]